MFDDDQFDRYVNTRFPETGTIRRLENGSIDYAHYVKAGRVARGTAFRNNVHAIAAHCRRYAEAIAGRFPPYRNVQPQRTTLDLAAPVRLKLISHSGATDQTAQPYSEAA